MKRILTLTFALVLVFGMAVSAFANSYDYHANMSHSIIDMGDGNTYLGTFQTSLLDEAGKEYMRDFFEVMTGKANTSDYYYIFWARGGLSNAYDTYYFIKMPNGHKLNIYHVTEGGSNNLSSPYDSSTGKRVSFNYYLFRNNYTSDLLVPFKGVYSGSNLHAGLNINLYEGTSATGCLIWTNDDDINSQWDNNDPGITSYYKGKIFASTPEQIEEYTFQYSGSLGFVDDDGLIDEVINGGGDGGDGEDGGETGGTTTPPGGDGGDDGGDGESGDTTIPLPDVEYDSSLVLYDLDIWDNILGAILPQLRKAFTIGFPIFLVFLGVRIAIALIKHFGLGWFRSKDGSGNKIHVDD